MKLIFQGFFLLIFFSSVCQTSKTKTASHTINSVASTFSDYEKIELLHLLTSSNKLSDTVKVKVYGDLGVLYTKLGVKDSADFYYRKAIIASQEYPLLHSRMRFLKDSLRFVTYESDSINLNNLKNERHFNLTKTKNLLVANNTKKDKILILSIFIFLLVIAIGIVLIITNRNKIRFQKKMLANLKMSKRALEDKQRLEAKLHIERGRTFANKEKQLVEVSLEMADLQNKLMEEINRWETDGNFKELAENLKSLLNKKNYWKYFKVKFIEVHPHFASLLSEMFPSLSENDIAFCCMLKLQVSVPEIASLMGKSEDEIESKITLLKRKMGLGNDPLAFHHLITHME